MQFINPYRYGGGGGDITDPNDISGCVVWIDGSDVGVTPDVWECKATNTLGNWSKSGNMPTDLGDGSWSFNADSLTGPNISSLTEGEIFLRLKKSGLGDTAIWVMGGTANDWLQYSSQAYLGFGSTLRRNFFVTPTAVYMRDNWWTLNCWSKTNDWGCYFDGNLDKTDSSNTVSFPSLPYIGKMTAAGYFYNGLLASMVVYDHKLSTADRAAVTAYMDTLMV